MWPWGWRIFRVKHRDDNSSATTGQQLDNFHTTRSTTNGHTSDQDSNPGGSREKQTLLHSTKVCHTRTKQRTMTRDSNRIRNYELVDLLGISVSLPEIRMLSLDDKILGEKTFVSRAKKTRLRTSKGKTVKADFASCILSALLCISHLIKTNRNKLKLICL